MYQLMNFIIDNKELISKLPMERQILLRAIGLYFDGSFEQVISECATICESLLRNICEKENIKCNKNNMFDMLEKISESVTNVKVGDRVVCANSAPCGECFYCKRGEYNLL